MASRDVVVSSRSAATASSISNGNTGHYDTPTPLYVTGGDTLFYTSNSLTNAWCNTATSCSNAAGQTSFLYSYRVLALVFRYGNASTDPNDANWFAVFNYVTIPVTPQTSTWIVPSTTSRQVLVTIQQSKRTCISSSTGQNNNSSSSSTSGGSSSGSSSGSSGSGDETSEPSSVFFLSSSSVFASSPFLFNSSSSASPSAASGGAPDVDPSSVSDSSLGMILGVDFGLIVFIVIILQPVMLCRSPGIRHSLQSMSSNMI